VPGSSLPPALAAELARGGPFHYDWRLADGTILPIVHPDLALAQRSVRELIEPDVRAALAAGGSQARALDLACNEGWWSQRLLEWGAAQVVGVEARAATVQRAQALREAFGISAAQLDLRVGDATALDPSGAGRFDVVLCLGLLYHLEDPIGALRRARALCRTGGLLVLETQTARLDQPIAHGWGSSDEPTESAAAGFAMRWERDERNPLASVDGVVSLIPNRAAVELALVAAGFADVEIPAPAPDHASGFRSGDRLVVLAR
jgi:SAM-dependent methyltransferase